MISDGIHGEGLLRELLHINHGYGQQEITKSTSPLKSVKQSLLSLTCTVIMFLIKHQQYCSLLVLDKKSFGVI
ncbi:hypothetical protein V6Z11_1Z090400 [Gossypium hirsutum]